MYIGEFSKKFGVSIDTTRYYIQLGLLIPKKVNNKYIFEDDCIDVMEEILSYKRLHFTLDEIRDLLNIKNPFLQLNKSNKAVILDYLISKQHNVEKEIDKLRETSTMLGDKIQKLNKTSLSNNTPIGIPKDFLNYTSCPICGKPLHLKSQNQKQYIDHDHLICHCGYCITIEEGIIMAKSIHSIGSYNFEVSYENIYENYKDICNNKLINDLQIFTKQLLLDHIRSKKIIVSMGYNYGKMLKNLVASMDKDCYFIIVEDNYDYIKYIKDNINGLENCKRIILIYSDMDNLPLRRNIAHLIIDVFRSDYLALYYKKCMIENFKNYLSSNSIYLRYFIDLTSTARSMSILPEGIKKHFAYEGIRKGFQDDGFIHQKSNSLGRIGVKSFFYDDVIDLFHKLNIHLGSADWINLYIDIYSNKPNQ